MGWLAKWDADEYRREFVRRKRRRRRVERARRILAAHSPECVMPRDRLTWAMGVLGKLGTARDDYSIASAVDGTWWKNRELWVSGVEFETPRWAYANIWNQCPSKVSEEDKKEYVKIHEEVLKEALAEGPKPVPRKLVRKYWNDERPPEHIFIEGGDMVPVSTLPADVQYQAEMA